MLQTLTNALLETSVSRMPYVTTPKDLTAAIAKMDLKATGKTARVRFCGVQRHSWQFCIASSKENSSKDRFSD